MPNYTIYFYSTSIKMKKVRRWVENGAKEMANQNIRNLYSYLRQKSLFATHFSIFCPNTSSLLSLCIIFIPFNVFPQIFLLPFFIPIYLLLKGSERVWKSYPPPLLPGIIQNSIQPCSCLKGRVQKFWLYKVVNKKPQVRFTF